MVCMLVGDRLCVLDVHRGVYASWFDRDAVVSDGGMYTCAPMDAVLVVLPVLERARRSAGEGAAVFVDRDAIFGNDAEYPDLAKLADLVPDEKLALVCETKTAGSFTYFRLCDRRALAYLACKARKGAQRLLENQGAKACVEGIGEPERLSYAVEILAEFLPATWAARLRTVLKDEMGEAAPAHQGKAPIPAADLPPVRDGYGAGGRPSADGKGESAEERRKRMEKLKRAAVSAQAKADKARKLAKGTASITSFFGGGAKAK